MERVNIMAAREKGVVHVALLMEVISIDISN